MNRKLLALSCIALMSGFSETEANMNIANIHTKVYEGWETKLCKSCILYPCNRSQKPNQSACNKYQKRTKKIR